MKVVWGVEARALMGNKRDAVIRPAEPAGKIVGRAVEYALHDD